MNRAVIYYRKSTDRDDKQANSLEHQLSNCRKTAQDRSMDIIEEIPECRSAKTEFTRPGFNRLIEVCNKQNIDYIIIDEPKRLSRNNIDTSRVIDLLDKQKIKGIIGTSRFYMSENSRDKFLLQLDLSLSKMDNEDRSKDVKEKMTSCTQNTGRFLAKAPFGYRNVTIKKGHKIIEVDEFKARIVRTIFQLRSEGKACSIVGGEIAQKYGANIGITLTATSIHRVVSNRFYYGIFSWGGKDVIGSHTPLVTKELFDKANSIGKGTYELEKLEPQAPVVSPTKKYFLKGLLKDVEGKKLTAYQKKGHTYYMCQAKSPERLNINEQLVFQQFAERLKVLDIKCARTAESDKAFLETVVRGIQSSKYQEIALLEKREGELKAQRERLVDMRLSGSISEELFVQRNNRIENDLFEIAKANKRFDLSEVKKKTQQVIELAGCLYKAYKAASDELKSIVIRACVIELSVTGKKSILIRESPELQCSKIVNFSYGTPELIDYGTFLTLLSGIDNQQLSTLVENLEGERLGIGNHI